MFKIKVPARLVSGEASLLSLHVATFSLGPHMAFSLAHMLLVSFPFLIRTSVLLNEVSTLKALFNLNYLLKGPNAKYSHVGG